MKTVDKFMYAALWVFVAFAFGFIIYVSVVGTVGWD